MDSIVATAMDAAASEVSLKSVRKRMSRLFAPRVDGSYLVPPELVEQYKNPNQRQALEQEFLKAGLDKDLFVTRSVKKVKRRESESEVWVSGQFVSDADMDELGLSAKRKKAVHDECAKIRGWIRRDRYEPDVKLYWLEKSAEGKMLKRKREIYEDVDSDADYEESDNEKDLDVFSMGWDLGEGGPKGDDATVAGADKDADVKQRMKSIGFPDMDADGLPSSYILKVVVCLGKWNTKITALADQMQQVKKTEKSDKIIEKAKTVAAALDKTSEEIQTKQSESVLQDKGFTLAQQAELKKIFDRAKKQPPDSSWKQGSRLDPWHWLKQLSEDVKCLERLHDEIVRDLQDTKFAEGAIMFDVATSNLASSILSHAELSIRSIFAKHPALFKIGVTTNPVGRWLHSAYGYKLDKQVSWERMTVLHVHSNADVICLLEASLIRIFFNSPGCRNIRCVEALSFSSSCTPMLQYMKTQKKRDDAGSKKVKAPAKSITGHMKASVLQKGAEATREELAGVLGVSEQNASRQLTRIVNKFAMLPAIRVSEHVFTVDSETYTLPYLKPRDVLEFLLREHSHLLLGGYDASAPEAYCELRTFWERYQPHHPTHDVYKPVAQTGQCLNGKFSSYLTRFLLAAFPSKQWPGETLSSILASLSGQMRTLFEEGLVVNGRRFYFGIMGLKADFEFHCTALRDAGLQRSYEHVGRANDIPVCIECEAGFPDIPMEDANVGARWTRTLCKSWPWTGVPNFAQMPFDNWQSFPSQAPQFFRRDPFHVFRLGIARNFLASAILLLCNLGAFDLAGESKSVDNRLVRAWRQFQLFLETSSLHVGGLRSFSKKKMHFASGGSFPWLGCKGSDTIVLLKWFKVLLVQLRIRGLAAATSSVWKYLEQAVHSGLQWSQGIHGHGIWYRKSCARHLRNQLQGFLSGYSRLAQWCMVQKMPLFGMTPKFHALAHFKLELEAPISAGFEYILNPAVFDCSMSEDFIGRISRQSRRIGFKKNLFEKHLLRQYKLKFGFVVRAYEKQGGTHSWHSLIGA
ncbi:unnamed protein product [Symbiodinium sp. CCMP2592]|nr:unnamed protein product [Symbiodinium sp. CCMP2592]